MNAAETHLLSCQYHLLSKIGRRGSKKMTMALAMTVMMMKMMMTTNALKQFHALLYGSDDGVEYRHNIKIPQKQIVAAVSQQTPKQQQVSDHVKFISVLTEGRVHCNRSIN